MDQKRQNLKNKLIIQFNISEEEAEKILNDCEIKNFVNFSNDETTFNKQHNIQINNENEIFNNQLILNENRRFQDDTIIEEENSNYGSVDSENIKEQLLDYGNIFLKKLFGVLGIKIEKNSDRFIESHYFETVIDNNSSEEVLEESNDSQNVDDILTEIIPDYNQHISIEVNHVDLTFEVSNEKIDTLKESFIRTVQGNKVRKFRIHALKDISFKVFKGEKVGIIGYNGAGKSTLLNVITGIYVPDMGYVKTKGNIAPLLSLGAGFDYNYSGRKNIFLNGAVLGYDKEYLESKVNEIIEFSELGDFIDIPIKNYSSGMLAKLGFSIATALEPDILIIDEILGVGDVNFNKKSRDKIKSLMDGGTTVLFVSHSIPQIRELCDKAIWMDNGELREIGEVNKICDHYIKDSEKASKDQLANIHLL